MFYYSWFCLPFFYYVSFKMTISVFSASFISNKQVWGLPCLNSASSVPTLRRLKWSWCQDCFVLVRAEPGICCCCIWSCRRIVDVILLSLFWIACVRKLQNPSKLFQRHHNLEGDSSILYQDRTSWSELMGTFLCYCLPWMSTCNKLGISAILSNGCGCS